MKNHLKAFASILLVASCVRQAGATIIVTLGDQDFIDGEVVTEERFEAAQAGEPAPIGTILGDDSTMNGATSFTFNFAAGVPRSAFITIGLLDDDGKAPGSQLDFFS